MNEKKHIAGSVAALAALAALPLLAADVAIAIDPAQDLIKDQRKSRTAPDLGYAGCIADQEEPYFGEFFVKNPDATWETFRKAGAYFVKQWSANETWFYGRAYAELKTDAERERYRKNHKHIVGDPKVAFEWRKKHHVPILLCLEQYSCPIDAKTNERSSDIADVKKHILEFVQWIVDNGYKEQVAGFELGNEPYFGSDPENYAERWSQIVPEIKRIFPEADIGFSIAEYRDGDPDIAAVRSRATNVDAWFEKSTEFGFQKINQWSGRFIVAFSNSLDYCSHVIYHFYGGDAAYGCGPCGFARVHNFAKAFPEVKDKRVWITEWRERSDEDCRCQQMHSSTLFKSHYLLAVLAQPDVDGVCLHSCNSLAGGFSIADGRGHWVVQWDPAGRDFSDPDFTGRPRLDYGPCGPVFQIYNEALLAHPLILKHGTRNAQGTCTNTSCWGCSGFYAWHHRMVAWHTAGSKPKDKPKNGGSVEWIAAADPSFASVALLVANTQDVPFRPTLAVAGRKLGATAKARFLRCDETKIFLHQIPGEPRTCWTEETAEKSDALEVPPYTVASLVIGLKKE